MAACVALAIPGFAFGANELRVGVVASRSSAAGAAQTLVATAWAARLRAAGGVFGLPVRLLLGDDGGSADLAVSLAREQVEAGALVVICCTTHEATAAVARYAEEAGVTLLAPRSWTASNVIPYWAFSLAPSDTDVAAAIVADAYRHGRASLALLAPDDDATAALANDLAALGALVGIRVVADERYPPEQAEVRPEALLVASHRPASVVVWGGPGDLARTATALTRRGYEGPVYGRSAALYPGEQALAWRAVDGVRFAVPPAAVAGGVGAGTRALPGEPAGGPLGICADAARRDAERLRSATSDPQPLATAPVLAALDVTAAALEQLLALQVPLTDPAAVRQAVRDALVGLPEQCSGAGAIDLEEGRRGTVLARSLAIAVATPTGLVAE